MFKSLKNFATMLSFLLLATALQGCSDRKQEQANALVKSVTITYDQTLSNLEKLEKSLNDTSTRGKYEMALAVAIDKVKRENPDNPAVQDMVHQFSKDMTTKGVPFESVKKDFNDVMKHNGTQYLHLTTMPKSELPTMLNFEDELARIKAVTSQAEFDERFIDYINTLAAISPSVKPVVVDSVAKNAAFGSQFVGNPQYGEWKTDSSGHTSWSFFEVYGFMSFIDDIFFDNSSKYKNCSYYSYRYNSCTSGGSGYYAGSNHNRYRYDNWQNTRNYSYYNDKYATKYEKPSVRYKYESNLTKHSKVYSKTIKTDTNIKKQNDVLTKTNPKYSSNLLASNKLKGKVGNNGRNNGGGSLRNQNGKINIANDGK